MSRDALVVGISNYQALPKLSAPAHDAEDMARCLESFGECRVVRLPEAIQNHKPTISQQAGVTTKMLEAALIRLFKPSGKNIPHTAIFYFSGHGLQRHAGIQEGYLATSDTSPDNGHYGLSLYWLRRLLQESPVRQRVVILDCCNSGEFFNILEADPGAKSGTDRLFMAASREYEEAYESLTGSHSVFTQALLSGLNPYKVKGSVVNGHHLIDTVNNQLKGELQQPLFESSGSEIVLTRAGGTCHQATPKDVSALDRLKQKLYKYCPFQGSAPFKAIHKEFFFGREELTQSLVTLVQNSRLSLVTGASGMGKTSLLRAGLMATLTQQNQAKERTQWDIRYVHLGHAPLKQLAEAFIDPQVTGLQRAEQIRTAESFFHNRAQGMTQLVQASLSQHLAQGAGDPRILLVIDQFEALFIPTDDAALLAQRQAVIDCLMAVVDKTHVPIHIVLSLRSQHLQDLEEYSALHKQVSKSCLWVSPMTYDQLKSTIVGPLEKIGLQYDANLIYTLLLDVVGAPGELALLQMVLEILWQHREPQASEHLPPRLTLETYVKLGGVRTILRQHATTVIEALPANARAVAQRILLSLCEFGEGSTPSRRQVEELELVTPTISAQQVAEMAHQLTSARLIVSHDDYEFPAHPPQAHQSVPAWSLNSAQEPKDSSLSQLFHTQGTFACHPGKTAPYLEICHDSLLHNWPIYEHWLREHRPIMKLQRAIETAAMEWHQHQHPKHPEYLISQTRLIQAKAFQAKQAEQLSALAHNYLEVCSQHARSLQRKRYLMRLLIALSMATGLLTAYCYNQMTRPAEVQRQAQAAAAEQSQGNSPPRYLKAEEGQADSRNHQNHSPLGPEPGADQSPLSSHSSFLPEWLKNFSRPGADQPQPLESHFINTLGPCTLGLETWQQHLDRVWQHHWQEVAEADGLGQSNDFNSSPGLPAMDLLMQPVAQWVSPVNPEQMIQVWCTRNSAEPLCVTSAIPRQPSSDLSAAPL
jgi:hypothetical protein